MRRMRKFKKHKETIKEKMTALKQKMVNATEEEITAALKAYHAKIKEAMALKRSDFNGTTDFKYGFRMPEKCVSNTSCPWICQNMVNGSGISDKAIRSDQNVKMEDIEE